MCKVSRSSTSGNTQPIYEDDEDGVVPTLEALISFLLAEVAFDTRSWFDTRYLTREPLRPTVLHYDSWACNLQAFWPTTIVTKYVRIVRKIRDLVQYGPKNVLYRILRTMMGP